MQNFTLLKRKIIFLNIITPFLLGTTIDLYVPSLPAIAAYFHVANYLVQLGIGLYMLGYAGGQIVFGILSDGWGRKKVLLGSVALFVLASFITIWAPNIYVLNICRLLQGLAAAGFTTCRAVTMDYFTDLELTKAMTYVSISWSLGPIVGPFIGGYLQHYFNWQADFYFFGCYGVLLFFYIFFLVPETHTNLSPLNPRNIYQAITSVIKQPIFLCYSLMLALTYAALVIFSVVGPFLIQVVLKYSVIEYGHIALLLGVAYFFGNTLSSRLIHYFKPMQVALFGIIGGIITSLVLVGLGAVIPLNLYMVIIPIFLLFTFCGLIFPNVMGTALGAIKKNAGIASATMGTVQIGGVFLVSILATTLKTDSQMPLAIIYVGMMLTNLLLFFIGAKLSNEKKV